MNERRKNTGVTPKNKHLFPRSELQREIDSKQMKDVI